MAIVKKVGVISFAKFQGVIMAMLGLIIGVLIAIFGPSMAVLLPETAAYSTAGIYSIILFPALYGIVGFVSGIVIAWLYNIASGWLGGIEIEIEHAIPEKKKRIR